MTTNCFAEAFELMKRALKTLGIMAGLLACQFCLGMLPNSRRCSTSTLKHGRYTNGCT